MRIELIIERREYEVSDTTSSACREHVVLGIPTSTCSQHDGYIYQHTHLTVGFQDKIDASLFGGTTQLDNFVKGMVSESVFVTRS
mmetsp:Transcript_18600/g.37327  ORF Transcript_18600/g.37327 Transcript_18600/m.37327 type:complete len:85 (+) Transcript_18600:863-1117(+)